MFDARRVPEPSPTLMQRRAALNTGRHPSPQAPTSGFSPCNGIPSPILVYAPHRDVHRAQPLATQGQTHKCGLHDFSPSDPPSIPNHMRKRSENVSFRMNGAQSSVAPRVPSLSAKNKGEKRMSERSVCERQNARWERPLGQDARTRVASHLHEPMAPIPLKQRRLEKACALSEVNLVEISVGVPMAEGVDQGESFSLQQWSRSATEPRQIESGPGAETQGESGPRGGAITQSESGPGADTQSESGPSASTQSESGPSASTQGGSGPRGAVRQLMRSASFSHDSDDIASKTSSRTLGDDYIGELRGSGEWGSHLEHDEELVQSHSERIFSGKEDDLTRGLETGSVGSAQDREQEDHEGSEDDDAGSEDEGSDDEGSEDEGSNYDDGSDYDSEEEEYDEGEECNEGEIEIDYENYPNVTDMMRFLTGMQENADESPQVMRRSRIEYLDETPSNTASVDLEAMRVAQSYVVSADKICSDDSPNFFHSDTVQPTIFGEDEQEQVITNIIGASEEVEVQDGTKKVEAEESEVEVQDEAENGEAEKSDVDFAGADSESNASERNQ